MSKRKTHWVNRHTVKAHRRKNRPVSSYVRTGYWTGLKNKK